MDGIVNKILQHFDKNAKGSAQVIILGILLFAIVAILLAILLTSSMSDVATKQLKYMEAGDLPKAYSLTSKVYQDLVPFNKFTIYVNKYPILKSHLPVTFTNRRIQGISGYISGKIEGTDHHTMLLEYEFIKENRHWKIQDIRLSAINPLTADASNLPATDASGASVQGILISDTADKNGFVDIEKLLISKTAPKIYATVQIIAPKGGTNLSAILTNLTTGEKIGPATSNAPKPGDVIKAFYFSRTTPNWAPGDYSVTVSLPTGASQTVKFKVQ